MTKNKKIKELEEAVLKFGDIIQKKRDSSLKYYNSKKDEINLKRRLKRQAKLNNNICDVVNVVKIDDNLQVETINENTPIITIEPVETIKENKEEILQVEKIESVEPIKDVVLEIEPVKIAPVELLKEAILNTQPIEEYKELNNLITEIINDEIEERKNKEQNNVIEKLNDEIATKNEEKRQQQLLNDYQNITQNDIKFSITKGDFKKEPTNIKRAKTLRNLRNIISKLNTKTLKHIQKTGWGGGY